MVFVLHDAADDEYAKAIAAGLAPRVVFATPLPQASVPTRFGAGAVCVVLWTPKLAAAQGLARVQAALPKAGGNVLICSVAGQDTPAALNDYGIMTMAGRADVDVDNVAAGLDYIAAGMAEHDKLSRGHSKAAPKLGASALAVNRRDGNLAARSAYGLALTLAAAGVTAPLITQMAQASGENVKSAAPPAPQLRLSMSETADAATVGLATEIADSSTPSVDEWLTEPSSPAPITALERRAPEPVLLQTGAAPVEVAAASELLLATPFFEAPASLPVKAEPVVVEMVVRTKAKASPPTL